MRPVIQNKISSRQPGFKNIPVCFFTFTGRAFVDENGINSGRYCQRFHILRNGIKVSYFNSGHFSNSLSELKWLKKSGSYTSSEYSCEPILFVISFRRGIKLRHSSKV